LISWPDQLEKMPKIYYVVLRFPTMASPKIMRLSANMRWETVKAGQITFKPLKTPLLSASQRREH